MEHFEGFFRVALVVFGIGLVIFVHELGHYIAARLCGVRVVTFSLGFGPRLLGWQRGGTMYQIAAVPLGGYCRMAGEEPRMDGTPPAPDELPAKSVEARFFIYSGGVLMNLVFALVVFPILFTVGVPFLRPVIGDVEPGGPAWHAEVPVGSEVLAVNGNEVLDFMHIQTEVALGDPEKAVLLLRSPGRDEPYELSLKPERRERLGLNVIGIAPGIVTDAAGRPSIDVDEDSPAMAAGLGDEDWLVAVLDGIEGLDLVDQIGVQTRDGDPMRLRVVDASGVERDVEIRPRLSEELASPRVGIIPPRNRVIDVRDSAATRSLGLRAEDRILAVAGREVLRLGDLQRALVPETGPLLFSVRRGAARLELSAPPLERAERLALARDIALAVDVESTRVLVKPGEPAQLAGLLDMDRLIKVDEQVVDSWDDVTRTVSAAGREGRAVTFTVERDVDGTIAYSEISAKPEALPFPLYGVNLRQDQYVYRAENLAEALRVGAFCSLKFLEDSWLTLGRMFNGQVSTDNLGGIISIGAISFTLAEDGWEKLFFFLCMLSINLAFLNVLPVPILDGGHLFFLIVEKIKGSPVSVRVLGYSQMVGVVLIISLMVYVTYNDLVKWVFQS